MGHKWSGGEVRSLVNVDGLHTECEKVLHESLLVPDCMYGSEAVVWKEKEISGIMAVKNKRLLGIYIMVNTRFKEMCEVKKELTERVLR